MTRIKSALFAFLASLALVSPAVAQTHLPDVDARNLTVQNLPTFTSCTGLLIGAASSPSTCSVPSYFATGTDASYLTTASTPTTLPATTGQTWNNGGMLAISQALGGSPPSAAPSTSDYPSITLNALRVNTLPTFATCSGIATGNLTSPMTCTAPGTGVMTALGNAANGAGGFLTTDGSATISGKNITGASNIAPHVATNAALTASSTATYPNGVWRDTFFTSGTAPPLFFTPSGSACSLNAGLGDGGTQVPSSDGKCWLSKISPNGLDVRQFGAVGDGSSHLLSSQYGTLAAAQAVYPFVTALTQEFDYAGIQAAINTINSIGGGTVLLPGKGAYRTATTIDCSANSASFLAFSGDVHGTLISNTSASNIATFDCNGSTFKVAVLKFKNLYMSQPTSAGTGNIAFNVVNRQETYWDHVTVYGYDKGIVLTTSYAPRISNSGFQVTKSEAVSATDGSMKGVRVVGTFFFGDGTTNSKPALALNAGGEGADISGNDFSSNYQHIAFDNFFGASVTGNYFETSTNQSIAFTNSIGSSGSINISGNTFDGDAAETFQYVDGLGVLNNHYYSMAVTFGATATRVSKFANSLSGGATLGAVTYGTASNPFVASSGLDASRIMLNGSTVLDMNGNFTELRANDGLGGQVLVENNTGSARNFYSNDTHIFRNRAASKTMLTLDASKAAFGVPVEGVASLPTISSCGTSPPAAAAGSTSNGGQFTLGTGSPSACTITFAQAFSNYAYCTATPASSYTGTYYVSASSKTAFTVTLSAGTSNVVFNYSCTGS